MTPASRLKTPLRSRQTCGCCGSAWCWRRRISCSRLKRGNLLLQIVHLLRHLGLFGPQLPDDVGLDLNGSDKVIHSLIPYDGVIGVPPAAGYQPPVAAEVFAT